MHGTEFRARDEETYDGDDHGGEREDRYLDETEIDPLDETEAQVDPVVLVV